MGSDVKLMNIGMKLLDLFFLLLLASPTQTTFASPAKSCREVVPMKSRFPAILVLVFMACVVAVPGSGSYYSCDQGYLPVMEQKVEVTIDNQVAVTRIEQVFFNPYDRTIEPTYRFPLGEKASVQEFGLTTADGQRHVGTLEEKHEAEAIYENAKNAGAVPAVAQQADPNSFETKLGAVGPRSRAKLDLTYSEILPYHQGKIQYNIPMNVAKVQNKELDLVSVKVTLRDQKEIVKVESPSHQISAQKVDGKNYSIFFEKARITPDCDFQLNYEVKAQRMGFNFLSTQPEKNDKGYFMMMLAPQEIVDAADIVARDIVFVMDVSGSMNGFKIEQTKQAFNFFIDQLNGDDRFGVVSFNDSVQPWRPGLSSADKESRQAAKDFINVTYAGGGTDIHSALATARNMFDGSPSTKAIVFLTDGEPTNGITNPDQILRDMTQGNTRKIRTFTLGVGDNVCGNLLDKIALQNRGEAVYFHQNENLTAKLTSFYETISKPLLVDLSLDFGGVKVSEIFPPVLPNVYKGSQLVVMGRYQTGQVATITISGTLNGQVQKFPVSANFCRESSENRFVARAWAKSRADAILQEISAEGETTQRKAEVISLSKKFQFTTPYTSFITVAPKQVVVAANSLDAYRNPPPNMYGHNPNSLPVQAMAVPSRPFSQALGSPNSPPPPPRNITVVRKESAKGINLWGAYSFLPLAPVMIPNFRKAREQSREKACYANMRVILGAVEMYNMDHSEMLHTISDGDLELLTQIGYLKTSIQRPETTCAYYTDGDLTGVGVIACAEHGPVEVKGTGYGSVSPYNPVPVPQVTVQDQTPWETKLWNSCIPVIELAINIPLVLLGLYFTYLFLKIPLAIFSSLFTPRGKIGSM